MVRRLRQKAGVNRVNSRLSTGLFDAHRREYPAPSKASALMKPKG